MAKEEEKFIEYTGYLFEFKECSVLIKGNEELHKGIDFKTVEEDNKLIEKGWTPIPF